MKNKEYLVTYVCSALPNSKLTQLITAKNRNEVRTQFEKSTSTSICQATHTILTVERLKE